MKKVQNASSHEKALDELLKRYEERGASYNQSPEYGELQTREITMRSNLQKTKREYTPDNNVELDTTVILQGIDQVRYGKKDNMNKDNYRNDVKSKLKAQADKTNPKIHDEQESNGGDNLRKDKLRKKVNVKEITKEAAKTWIPLNERNEEKIEQGSKIKAPVTLIFAIIVITLSLMMIVASAVLLGSAKNEQNELEEKIALLDVEISELRTDLDRKNAAADIETFAKEELGMISQEHVNFKYINSNKNDELIVEETEKVSLGSLIKWIFQQLR